MHRLSTMRRMMAWVRQQGLVDDPLGLRGAAEYVLTDRRDAPHHRRFVLPVEPLRDGGHVLDELCDVVRQEVDGGDEEVAASHGGVEHLQVEHRLGGVELV